MGSLIEIGIWDEDTDRLKRTNELVDKVLRKMHLKAFICANCEPPHLSRSPLSGKYPALEIGGDYWSLTPGEDFTEEQIERLFHKLLAEGAIPL